MNNIIPFPNQKKLYLVFYVTGVKGEDLHTLRGDLQANQDTLVVAADDPNSAYEVAQGLLMAQCEFTFVITKVTSRDELEFLLSNGLARVEAGDILPASLNHGGCDLWNELYTYCTLERDPLLIMHEPF